MTARVTAHRWRLVAPWYRWERRDGAEPERAAGAGRPALHKYTSTGYVADYLADPQRSVVFGPVDQYQQLEPIPHVPLPGDTRKRHRFLATTRFKPSGVRKLFPVAHQRHYVVAVGLHCDDPGFPRVDPGDVAEAGFVVRRQRVAVPVGQEKAAAALLQAVAAAKTEQTRRELTAARDRARALHPFGTALRARLRDPDAAAVVAHRELETARRALRVWASTAGVDRRTEAWVPTGDGAFGEWVPIADEPEELVERRYPLRLLTAPAADPDHPARDGTIYWGTVPTASAELSRDGSARFTELGTYEVRAFARMRGCGDCPGPLVWSAPSEAYRLASFHDPDGCAQRPVEIRLPDFAQLEASNATPSVRMSSPPASSFVFAEDGRIPTSGSVRPGADFCFFAIPLITIVATFVLKLFLPIVTLVFGLFWMLKLKFCIPPSLQLEADLTAELDVVPGGIEASLHVDIDVQAGVDQSALEGVLRSGLDTDRPGQHLGTTLTSAYTNDPVVELLARQGYGAPPGQPFPVFGELPEYTTGVRPEEVVHP
ncbi:hypothetical protein ACWDWO_13530 [Actinopolymorpha singaporensis]